MTKSPSFTPTEAIEEICRLTGASSVTVRRVLRTDEEYRRPTFAKRAKRIRELALEFGYRPNTAAKAIATGRFHAVAMLSRDQIGPIQNVVTTGAYHALHDAGMRMVYTEANEQLLEQGEPPPLFFRELSVDGALVHFAKSIPEVLIESFNRTKLPAVFLNTRARLNCVFPDDREAAGRLTRQLVGLGHRRIGYCKACANSEDIKLKFPPHYSEAERLEGYLEAMRASGLPEFVLDPPDHLEPISERIQAWRKDLATPQHPTAWIIYDNQDVGACVAAAAALGMSVPDDLSVVGFRLNQPVVNGGGIVSSMRIPFHEIATEGVRRLLGMISGETQSFTSVRIPFEDATPETMAPPPGK